MATEKTYQYDMNRAYTPTGANATALAADLNKYVLWYWKAFLTGQIGGATLGLWNVAGSSDGVTAGMDAVDRWTNVYTNGKLTNQANGSPHSWVVLQSPVLGGNTYYVLLDYNNTTNSHAITLGVSSAAPTGGTISAAPTMNASTASISYSLNGGWGGIKLHGALATDGTFFVFASRDYTNNFFSGFIGSLLLNAKAGDLYPFFVHTTADTALNPASTQGYGNQDLTNSVNIAMRSADGTGTPAHGIIIPAVTGSNPIPNLPLAADAYDGTFWDWPVWVGCAASGYKTIRGRVPDMLYNGGIIPTQGCVDNAAAPNYMSVGKWWFPANAAPIL